MHVQRSGTRPTRQGPAGWFTGSVRMDPLPESAAARFAALCVTFEPGARTIWHSHPPGQLLVVTAGVGRVQRWTGPVEDIRPGDVVWIEPGEKHWHGAGPTTAMTHIAVQEPLDGRTADWMEAVSDAQYRGLAGDAS